MGLQALKIVKEEIARSLEQNDRQLLGLSVAFVLGELETCIESRIEKECIEVLEEKVPCWRCCRPADDHLRAQFRNSDEDLDLCNGCIESMKATGVTFSAIPKETPGDSYVDALFEGDDIPS